MPFSLPSRVTPGSDPVKAALLVITAGFFFSAMNVLIRHMASELHPLQIVFLRNFFGFAVLVPWLVRGGLNGLRVDRPGLIGLRGLLSFISMSCWFSALAIMPLGTATALAFTAPLFGAVAAVVVLREVIRIRRISALAVGFCGMLIILRPGVDGVGTGELLVIASAFMMSLSMVTMKILTRTVAVSSIVFYQTLLTALISLLPACLFWSWPSPGMWLSAFAIGAVGTAGHMLFTRGFSLAETTYLMPIDYLRLPQMAFLGWIVFGETTDVWTWVGGAIIAASTVYVAHREQAARRQLAEQRLRP